MVCIDFDSLHSVSVSVCVVISDVCVVVVVVFTLMCLQSAVIQMIKTPINFKKNQHLTKETMSLPQIPIYEYIYR